MSDLPDQELSTFLLSVEEAVDPARSGEIHNGFRYLSWGLETAQDEGEPWREELVRRYGEALDRYTREYGDRLLE